MNTSAPIAAPQQAPAQAGQAAVVLTDLTRTYVTGKQSVEALRGVSHAFERGTFTAIMGPSGSGKSTLLQCAAGLDRPTSGSVVIGGQPLEGLSEAELSRLRRDRVGFVFQQFNLIPSLTAVQNVALPLLLAHESGARRAAKEALGRVGLADRGRHRPHEMSGGQQQRVAIARALVTRPDVIFADEPTGALDSSTGRDVLTMMRDLVDREALTVVMVTHDPRVAAFADHVVLLADGVIAGRVDDPDPESVAEAMTHLGGFA